MSQMVNCRLRISLVDGRLIVGQLLAYDKHMNLVVADCEEFRLHKRQQLAQQKSINAQANVSSATATATATPLARRALGMIVLRGEEIVTIATESAAPPRGGNRARVPASQQQQPLADATSMGMPMAPPSTAMFVRPGMPPGQF